MGNFIDYVKGLCVGDVVKVNEGGNCIFYKITGKDNLKIYQDFATIEAEATGSNLSIDALNPKAGMELYQIYRIVPVHNVLVSVKQPASTLRWGSNIAPEQSFLTQRTSSFDGGITLNIWITSYQQPNVVLKNNTTEGLIAPRVYFIGHKYRVRQLPSNYDGPATPIQYGGFD